jgi:uncharacterized protein with von Willebrand factor type A (vWA) domain
MSKNNQVVIKDAFDKLAFDGVSEASALAEQISQDVDAVSDTFASFYKMNVETTGDSTRKQIMEQMLALPEYQSLHQTTQLDDISSALAASEFSKNLIDQIQKVEQKVEQAKEQNQPTDLESVLGEQGMGALRATLRRSLERSEEKAEEWGDLKSQWGIDKGELSEMSGFDRMNLAEQLLQSSRLKKISSFVGRFKNVANAASTMTFSHGNDEIIDITTGSNLERMLPSELIRLKTNPLDFYRAYLEGSLQQYNLKGNEPKGKGPIIVALDVSGSMLGWPEEYARALTIALSNLAAKEKRAFSVIFFDSQVQDVRFWQKNSKVSLTERIEIINRRSDGGGTDFAAPLAKALEIRSQLNPELKPADLVFITDGDCALPEGFASEFEFAKKKTDLRVYGFAIGSPRSLNFCDSVYQITDEGQIEEVKDMMRKAATRK